MGVDFNKLVEKFHGWAKNYVDLEESEWCAGEVGEKFSSFFFVLNS
jgi:hypothetical protein